MTTALIRIPKTTYKRKAWIDRFGHRHPAKTVTRKAYKKKDTGKPGRTPKRKRWFVPGKKSGWKKSSPSKTRRQSVLKAYKGDLLKAAREVQALANVTTDPETRQKALRDAKYFFQQYKEK
jgi:hypothetical protein